MPQTDRPFRFSTDSAEVRRFLASDLPGVGVIFCTYHSTRVVAEGIKGLPPLDLGVFDEAHKTTGPAGGAFARALRDGHVPIRRRLFMTATPRHYDIRHRNREGDFRPVSMDDRADYGPVAHRLSFAEAARRDIICNYKVIISVVDGKMVSEFALRNGITLIETDLVATRWVGFSLSGLRGMVETSPRQGGVHWTGTAARR